MPKKKPLEAFEDPNHRGNSTKYHTGKPCVTPGCLNPAGTAWSPLWCQPCNVDRIRRITRQLEQVETDFKGRLLKWEGNHD